MPGTLYVVATPIGNLEDVTLRALRVLREVSLIAAEDTRRTARLLQHYSISTPTTSLHEHNERSRTPGLVGRLCAGESIALVSDAGTPIVSDPGTFLVAAAHAAGVRVEAVPGPSAVIAALSASGLAEREFVFLGFPPARALARRTWLEKLAKEERVMVVYEAPHRIRATLAALSDAFGERMVAVAREISKKHEELVVRPINYFVASPPVEMGEFTVVISGFRPNDEQATAPEASGLALMFVQMTNVGGLTRRAAIKQLAVTYRLSARDVFKKLEDAKKLDI